MLAQSIFLNQKNTYTTAIGQNIGLSSIFFEKFYSVPNKFQLATGPAELGVLRMHVHPLDFGEKKLKSTSNFATFQVL